MDDNRFLELAPVMSIGDMRRDRRGDPVPMAAGDLKALFSGFGWSATFGQFARLAALTANGGGSFGADPHEFTIGLLSTLHSSTRREEREVAAYVARSTGRAIANEAAFYFSEAMAILYGADEGPEPAEGMVAYMLLAANDYAMGWRHDDSATLSRKARLLANMVRVLPFNDQHDPLPKLLRGAALLERPPRRDRQWKDPVAWFALQQRAFGGRSLIDYVAELVAPVYLHSLVWASRDETGHHQPFALKPKEWLSQTENAAAAEEGEAFLRSLAMDRARARTELRSGLSANGLPIGTAAFSRFPFVEANGDVLWPASPWAVREHLRGGVRFRLRTAALAEDPKRGSDRWSSAFGDIFEDWCREIAGHTRDEGACPDNIVLAYDEEEIEDVVVTSKHGVAIFSVKATVQSERVLKLADSPSAAVDWYDGFLLSDGETRSGQPWRAGAYRQLLHKIERIRLGDFEPTIPRRARIYPVIVTYDDLGLDNTSVYRWLHARCNERRIKRDSKTGPLACASVDTFESLFALGARGQSIVATLEKKSSNRWKEARLEVFLRRHASRADLRHPTFAAALERLEKRIGSAHWPVESAAHFASEKPAESDPSV